MQVEFEITQETLDTLREIADGAEPENNERLQKATYEIVNRTIMFIAESDKAEKPSDS